MAYAKINSITNANMAKVNNAAKAALGKIGSIDAPAAADDAFTFTVNTANAGTASDVFDLPLVDDGTINFTVDWGDSTTDTITSYNQAESTHTYAAGAGTYTIKLEGTIRGFRFNGGGDRLKILNISNWGDFNFTIDRTFYNCANLDCSATDAPAIEITTLTMLFYQCASLTNIGGLWDMSNVQNLQSMLALCNVFNDPNVADWDTSSVTSMRYPFYGTNNEFDQDLSGWDINQVTDFQGFAQNGWGGMSVENYDALLIGWDAQSGKSANEAPNFGSAKYTGGGTAATARANMISSDGWTISDGGIA